MIPKTDIHTHEPHLHRYMWMKLSDYILSFASENIAFRIAIVNGCEKG